MKKFLLMLLVIAAPAQAQTQLVPKEARTATKGVAARVDECAPIGRTARGELVYSMKCENMPAPPPPPPQAAAPAAAPPAEPEVQRSGLFGMSYDRRQQGE